MTNEELLAQYENATSGEVMEAIAACENDKEEVTLRVILRGILRDEEKKLRTKVKQEAEDSKEEKAALKATHAALFESRKAYLDSYRNMNKIMSGKSMLKHLDDFKVKVSEYENAQEIFQNALDSHIEKLAQLKNG